MLHLPNPDRSYETFLPLGRWMDPDPADFWQAYLLQLRQYVAPLVRKLQASGTITWYGFLVHDFGSGVPTLPTDDEWFVHLRVTLSPSATVEELYQRIPGDWVLTQPIVFPDPPYLDRVDIFRLRDGNVGRGWALLGDFSEWVLRFIEAHDPDGEIPYANAAQLVHYLDNMLLLDMMRPRSAAPPQAKGKGGQAKKKRSGEKRKKSGGKKKDARSKRK